MSSTRRRLATTPDHEADMACVNALAVDSSAVSATVEVLPVSIYNIVRKLTAHVVKHYVGLMDFDCKGGTRACYHPVPFFLSYHVAPFCTLPCTPCPALSCRAMPCIVYCVLAAVPPQLMSCPCHVVPCLALPYPSLPRPCIDCAR